jgi:hypothetical protein
MPRHVLAADARIWVLKWQEDNEPSRVRRSQLAIDELVALPPVAARVGYTMGL